MILPGDGGSLRRLEAVGLATKLIVYADMLAYMRLHFEAEMALLTPLGPQLIQGYLFGRPMDDAAVSALLDAPGRAPRAVSSRNRRIRPAAG